MQDKLRRLPGVDKLLAMIGQDREVGGLPHQLVVGALRQVVEDARRRLMANQDTSVSPEALTASAKDILVHATRPSFIKVVNAAGVALHTNLGRAPLSARARARLADIISGYSTLEYNLATGERGTRYFHVTQKICQLTGAEDALAVNNNAAAILLALSALTEGREVIVSRGQLVEIGGSFRVPDVLQQSGAKLVEVGTTNKTHLGDYAAAIGPNTAAILKVHTSNYRIIGFTAQPEDAALVKLAHEHGLPVIDDLGSGTLIPVNRGGWREPTAAERLAAGTDIVTFSGDKLLGSSQAGIIAGKKQYLEKMRAHPLLRAIRIDKLSLAALEGTLLDYLVGEPRQDVPIQRMLNMSEAELTAKAGLLAEQLGGLKVNGWQVKIAPVASQAGGGALPGIDLPSYGVSVSCRGKTAAKLERELRQRPLPIIARIIDDWVVFDVRCLAPEDMAEIKVACMAIAAGREP